MKTSERRLLDGSTINVEYDEKAPCVCCGEPVIEASVGGTVLCPWCDMGICRYCGVKMLVLRDEIDNGRSARMWREHMKWHRFINSFKREVK